jgi:hypothetical protein
MKKNSLISVRQIIRQIPVKASVVRQPKKIYCEMIGMGAKSSTIVTAVTADFFFDCWVAIRYGGVLLSTPLHASRNFTPFAKLYSLQVKRD